MFNLKNRGRAPIVPRILDNLNRVPELVVAGLFALFIGCYFEEAYTGMLCFGLSLAAQITSWSIRSYWNYYGDEDQ